MKLELFEAEEPEFPEGDDQCCSCGKAAVWRLAIDGGQIDLRCKVCGGGLYPYWHDNAESVYMEAEIPVELVYERPCTVRHETSCDCDDYLKIVPKQLGR
jgi:hypothetical protein